MTNSPHSTELSAAEAAVAEDLWRLLSGYPRDAVRQGLNLAAIHFKLKLKRRHKPRQPTLARVSKQAAKAGIEVARYEIKPDGTFVVVTGKSESTESNPWLDDLKVTKQ
jgi:hypothetical protein